MRKGEKRELRIQQADGSDSEINGYAVPKVGQAANKVDKGEGGLCAADPMPPPIPAGELVGDNFISRSRVRLETELMDSGFTWLVPSRLFVTRWDRDDAPSIAARRDP